MAKRYNIIIEKVADNEYSIHKNIHLEFLIRGCHGFYSNIVQHMQEAYRAKYVEKSEFIIELESTNYRKKNMKRFLKTAENFISEIKKFDLQLEEIKKW